MRRCRPVHSVLAGGSNGVTAGVSTGASGVASASLERLSLRPRALILMMPDLPLGLPHASQAVRGAAPLATISTARFTSSFRAGRGISCLPK